MKTKKVLGLRTVNAAHKARNNFQWPESGFVEASDWDTKAECGNGLHALIKGEGNHGLLLVDPDAIWQVVEIVAAEIVDLDGKAKFPRCNVIYSGSKEIATRMVKEAYPEAAVAFANVSVGDGKVSVVGGGGFATAGNCGKATAGNYGKATAGERGTATAGNHGTVTAGYSGTAAAGDWGTATAGNYGTATTGDYGKATAGNKGTATAGNEGTATAGDYGKATAGNDGTATAGYNGTATAGNCGTATAGHEGTATAGNDGTATAGEYGTATAGEYGRISITYFDGKRQRQVIGYVGEDGLLPNVAYRLNDGKFVQA